MKPKLSKLTVQFLDGRIYRVHRNGRARALVNIVYQYMGDKERIDAVEVGVGAGRTSVALLWAFPQLRLSMIDPYDIHSELRGKAKHTIEGRRRIQRDAEHITRNYADRRVIMIGKSLDVADHFGDESLDLIFVDALHRYEDVKDDLAAWWPKLRDGGMFVGDNYDGKMDRRGLWGVKRAVDEFAGRRGYELCLDMYNKRWGGVWWFRKEADIEQIAGLQEQAVDILWRIVRGGGYYDRRTETYHSNDRKGVADAMRQLADLGRLTIVKNEGRIVEAKGNP